MQAKRKKKTGKEGGGEMKNSLLSLLFQTLQYTVGCLFGYYSKELEEEQKNEQQK